MLWATLFCRFLAAVAPPASKKTTHLPPQSKPVVLDAARDELLDKYNEIARGVKA